MANTRAPRLKLVFVLSLTILVALPFGQPGRAMAVPQEPDALPLSSGGVVQLPPFVVQAASAPARLRIDFRHHMIWARLKGLTFTEVPAAWAKAGIKAGDHVIRIDGKRLDGMRLIGDFVPLLRAKLDPLTQKKVAAVHFLFELSSDESKSVRRIDVTMKSSTKLTIYSYGF